MTWLLPRVVQARWAGRCRRRWGPSAWARSSSPSSRHSRQEDRHTHVTSQAAQAAAGTGKPSALCPHFHQPIAGLIRGLVSRRGQHRASTGCRPLPHARRQARRIVTCFVLLIGPPRRLWRRAVSRRTAWASAWPTACSPASTTWPATSTDGHSSTSVGPQHHRRSPSSPAAPTSSTPVRPALSRLSASPVAV